MTWFLVDDGFHSHSKARKVAAKCPAALGLWVLAGSWCSDKLTDGFVGDDDLPWILPGSEELAAELVAARLWRRVKGGYQFHDFGDVNKLKEQVLVERDQAKERMRKLRAERSREVRPNKRGTSRPKPEVPKGTSTACARHPGSPAHNCAGCRSEELGKK